MILLSCSKSSLQWRSCAIRMQHTYIGENGTGKDVIARLLYRNSPRYGKPFVTIDLGSIPEQLFESELFGYEKGAFTDARKAKAGRMEVATGGTLFLDEIGNLSLPMQAKLLTASKALYQSFGKYAGYAH